MTTMLGRSEEDAMFDLELRIEDSAEEYPVATVGTTFVTWTCPTDTCNCTITCRGFAEGTAAPSMCNT